MRRRDLILGALFSIALIAGVAWYGEITRGVPFKRPPPDKPTVIEPLPPVDPDPVNTRTDDDKPKPHNDAVVPVQLDIAVAKPPAGAFTQQVEPIRPTTDTKGVATIPPDRDYSGLGDQPLELSQLDRAPIARYQARPEYPEDLKRAGITGDALVDFIVDPNGDVRNAVAVRPEHREFGDAACRAVSKWKFRPGWKNGRAVFTHMQVPIVFTLADGN